MQFHTSSTNNARLNAKGMVPDLKLVNKKLELYQQTFELESIEKHIQKMEKTWQAEMKKLMNQVPDFGVAKSTVIETLKNLEKTPK